MLPSWANLPDDVLLSIATLTNQNPARFAGVCKAWAGLLDAESARRAIVLRDPVAGGSLRSLALFLCKRPPRTTRLEICLADSFPPTTATTIAAAVAPVVTHLSPSLRTLVLDAPLAEAFVSSPASAMCTALEFLNTHVTRAVDLAPLKSLIAVDLTFSGAGATKVWLPDSLVVCRLHIEGSTNPFVVDHLLAALPTMRRLRSLYIYSAHQCTIHAASLAPTLTALVVGGDVFLSLVFGGAVFPELRVLGVRMCQFTGEDVASFLSRCTTLVAIQWADNWALDWARLDMRHLPLKVVHVLSATSRPLPSCEFPAGIRKAALGAQDLYGAMAQPALRKSVQTLQLDLHRMDPDLFCVAWPSTHRLPALRHVTAAGEVPSQVAALLGQRCHSATLLMTHAMFLDIELDEDVMV